MIQNTIEKADGRRIVLSLSAGLDSRLILSKLLENKYDNIECISWGPIGNGDSTGAKTIAKKAGVKFLAYRCKINLKEIIIEKKIKIIND